MYGRQENKRTFADTSARRSSGASSTHNAQTTLARCKAELHDLQPDQLPSPFSPVGSNKRPRRTNAEAEFSQLKFSFIDEEVQRVFIQGAEEADPAHFSKGHGTFSGFSATTGQIEATMKDKKNQNRQLKAELKMEGEKQMDLCNEISKAHQELKTTRERACCLLRDAGKAHQALQNMETRRASTGGEPASSQLACVENDAEFGAKLVKLREENNLRSKKIAAMDKENKALLAKYADFNRTEGPLRARVAELEGFQELLGEMIGTKFNAEGKHGTPLSQINISATVGGAVKNATVSTEFDSENFMLKNMSVRPDLGLDEERTRALRYDDLPSYLTEVVGKLDGLA